MTDEANPALTRAQEEAVRRRLAEARVDEPMPPAVVERLDGVLADLVSQRAPQTDATLAAPQPTLVPLRSRARRVLPRLLVAAAAVVVVGVGLSQTVGQGGGPDSATSGADVSDRGGQDGAEGTQDGAEAPAVPESRPDAGAAAERAPADPVEVRAQSFRRDVALLPEQIGGLDPRSAQNFDEIPGSDTSGSSWLSACPVPETEAGDRVLAALLDNEPALLVFRAPLAGRRKVEAFGCDAPGRSPVARTTIPAGP